jgi:hypothetical protein
MGAALQKTKKRPRRVSNSDSHSNVCGYGITIQPQPRRVLNSLSPRVGLLFRCCITQNSNNPLDLLFG